MNISKYTPTADHVLIEMKKEDYLNIYSKKIKTLDGGIITFDFDTYVDPTDHTLKMSKEIGDVVAIGPDCNFCKVGDCVILDYTVDMDQDCIVHETESSKFITIKEQHSYVDHDHGAYNENGIYCRIFNKGDMIQQSNIYGVIRDENIICNSNYVIFAYKDVDANFELSPGGIWFPKKNDTGDLMSLTIDFCPAKSKYKRGDIVLVYQYYVFTKDIQCNAFLMAYETDILGIAK